jgi:hypothetical protein
MASGRCLDANSSHNSIHFLVRTSIRSYVQCLYTCYLFLSFCVMYTNIFLQSCRAHVVENTGVWMPLRPPGCLPIGLAAHRHAVFSSVHSLTVILLWRLRPYTTHINTHHYCIYVVSASFSKCTEPRRVWYSKIPERHAVQLGGEAHARRVVQVCPFINEQLYEHASVLLEWRYWIFLSFVPYVDRRAHMRARMRDLDATVSGPSLWYFMNLMSAPKSSKCTHRQARHRRRCALDGKRTSPKQCRRPRSVWRNRKCWQRHRT